MASPTNNRDTSNSTGTLTTSQLIAAIGALFVLLLLVQPYPKVIIGFMLLILVGVILTHSSTISDLFSKL